MGGWEILWNNKYDIVVCFLIKIELLVNIMLINYFFICGYIVMFKFLFRSKLSLFLDGLGCLVNLI